MDEKTSAASRTYQARSLSAPHTHTAPCAFVRFLGRIALVPAESSRYGTAGASVTDLTAKRAGSVGRMIARTPQKDVLMRCRLPLTLLAAMATCCLWPTESSAQAPKWLSVQTLSQAITDQNQTESVKADVANIKPLPAFLGTVDFPKVYTTSDNVTVVFAHDGVLIYGLLRGAKIRIHRRNHERFIYELELRPVRLTIQLRDAANYNRFGEHLHQSRQTTPTN